MSQIFVYLVDDDDDVRQAIKYALESAGYQVRAFVGAQNFQAIASSITEGVLILDMRMPGVSGLELQRWLIDRGYRIPIVFISGESQSIEIVDALKLDAVDFLIKPFALSKLLEAVEKASRLDKLIREKTIRERKVRLLWSNPGHTGPSTCLGE